MSPEQKEYFQQLILDYAAEAFGEGTLEGAQVTEQRHRETGDRVTLYLDWAAEDRLAALRWQASGSTVLRASCAMMAAAAEALPEVDALRAHTALFLEMLTAADFDLEAPRWQPLSDALALCGIRQLPARVQCASLPWHTLRQALAQA